MITKWKICNFKSIRKETELKFAPLTIFAGANSSGKSSVLQSVLLVAQTLTHKVRTRPIVLNGAFSSLGQFDDLKSNGSDSDQIQIEFTCCPVQNSIDSRFNRIRLPKQTLFYNRRFNHLKEISCNISFGADSTSVQRDYFQIQPQLYLTRLSCVSEGKNGDTHTSLISVHRKDRVARDLSLHDEFGERSDKLNSGLQLSVELDEDSMSEIKEEYPSAKIAGCTLHHFVPEEIICEIDPKMEEAIFLTSLLQAGSFRTKYSRRIFGHNIELTKSLLSELHEILKDVIDFDKVFDFSFEQISMSEVELREFTSDYLLWQIEKQEPEDQNLIRRRFLEVDDLYDRIYLALKDSAELDLDSNNFVTVSPPGMISAAGNYLEKYFGLALRYLGPLRVEPKPLYPLVSAADPNDIGLRGEHTALILDLHKNKEVEYIPSKNFQKSRIEQSVVSQSLEDAVIDWLKYLGVADSVASQDQGKLGHELKVSSLNSNDSHDLTHVGVGVSQVLPILVMCLLADRDSTLVFEQPELHLHPRVQSLLGDFFLSMALCNKQCLVETHSEYLIDRLRFRIAATPMENDLTDKAKIYFVDNQSQSSTFCEVNVNEYGAITNWPEGFFDQSQQQAEAILKAAVNKRKQKQARSEHQST